MIWTSAPLGINENGATKFIIFPQYLNIRANSPWQRYCRIYGIASSGMYYFKDKWIYFDSRKSDSAKYALWRRKYMMLFSWRHGNVLVNVVKDDISQQ